MKVAVLGTGIMGAPMARNLAEAGLEVAAWNRTEEKAMPLADDGVTVASTVPDAVEGADVVVTMLIDGDAVLDVMEDGGLAAIGDDAVWAQMSTVGLEMTERCAELAAEHGAAFIDAPVLGTKGPAENAQLVVLAAGPQEARKQAEPVFDAVGQKTVWFEQVGDATKAKLVLNSWVMGIVESLAETMALAEALGIEKQLFLDTIKGGALDIGYAHMKGELIIDGEFPPAFPLSGAAKDLGLILEAAEQHGAKLPMLEVVREQFERGVEAGHGDEDMISAFRVVAPGEGATAKDG